MSDSDLVKKNSTALASRSEEFIALFEADRKRIYAYIYAFVMDSEAANEIFQETSVLLWRDFDKFEANSNFSKWANGIVFNRVRTFRRQEKKHDLCLSDEVVGQLADKISPSDTTEQRWLALQSCRGQLPPLLQQLYTDFYVQNATATEVAEKTGKSVFAIRKSIQKLRKLLFDCVDGKQQEGQL